eukprot:226001-Chlamydomonas_euryale.AAC.1
MHVTGTVCQVDQAPLVETWFQCFSSPRPVPAPAEIDHVDEDKPDSESAPAGACSYERLDEDVSSDGSASPADGWTGAEVTRVGWMRWHRRFYHQLPPCMISRPMQLPRHGAR